MERIVLITTTDDDDAAIADALAWHMQHGGPSRDEAEFLTWILQTNVVEFGRDARDRTAEDIKTHLRNDRVPLLAAKSIIDQASAALSAATRPDVVDDQATVFVP